LNIHQEASATVKVLYLAILAALAMCGSASAQNVPPAEERYIPYSGNLPPCDENWKIQTIMWRFQETRREFWHSDLQMLFFDRIHEIGYRSNGLSYIPRRYCAARAFFNDCDPRVNPECKGRAVIYVIAEKTNMIGWNDGVMWCVVGLDPSLAYAPNCRALKPIIDTDILGEGGLEKLTRELLRQNAIRNGDYGLGVGAGAGAGNGGKGGSDVHSGGSDLHDGS
jgi:hypothetical protein